MQIRDPQFVYVSNVKARVIRSAVGIATDQLKRNAFNAQVMFSNLGRVPFDSTFGQLNLETIWAAVALRGIEGEQNLGAVIVNGSLHLTHTSPAPVPGLLAGIEEELRKACAI